MKTYKIITVALFATLLASCTKKEEKSNQEVASPKMEIVQLQKQSITSLVKIPAELTGFNQVDLFAKVTSYVKSLKVDIGSDVKENQLLIQLEAPEISSQVAAALSRLHSQEAIYTSSNGTYQRLFETSKVEGTISKNDLEIALSKKNSDFAQLQAARASYKEAQVMQSYLQIRAPFSGKITARNVNTGAYVGQGGTLPLLTLQGHNKLRLSASIPEAYTGYLNVGDQISFAVSSLKGETFKAKISRMSGSLDQRLRSERIEFDVSNTNGVLLPGMVAEVLLSLKSDKTPFVVQKSSIINTSEGIFVIKVVEKKAQRINVTLGLESDGKVEIFSNLLLENDSLILNANEEIKDGYTIN